MRFLSATLVSLLLCAASYGALAYLVNPRGDFETEYFPRVVLPDRAAKLRLFEAFVRNGGPPSGLILGSSRSLKLKPSDMNKAFGGRFFNFAVTGATVEDYSGIYSWVRQHGVMPRQLVIGLDVEALHSDEQYGELLSVPELRSAFEGKSAPSARERIAEGLKHAQNVYRIGFLRDTLQSILLKFRSSPPRWSFDSDGYVRYRASERQRAAGTFDYPRVMAESATRYRDKYREMTGLSVRRRNYLEALIRRATADGAHVLIWITPLHPQALAEVERGTRYMMLVEQTAAYLMLLRERYHIKVADLHDPSTYGASASYWYDCVHYDEPAARRIIATLAGLR